MKPLRRLERLCEGEAHQSPEGRNSGGMATGSGQGHIESSALALHLILLFRRTVHRFTHRWHLATIGKVVKACFVFEIAKM
jgi:hypothetical protein